MPIETDDTALGSEGRRRIYDRLDGVGRALARLEGKLDSLPDTIGNAVGQALSGHVRDYHTRGKLPSYRPGEVDKQVNKVLVAALITIVSALGALVTWIVRS